ncbi:hypothetical protein, partial [Microlunatus aurantiacus]|uniref:hypothetical protein n=1 Tax=Microlunatus aurantiacus TaxID=446786 RepID=UPI0031D3897D
GQVTAHHGQAGDTDLRELSHGWSLSGVRERWGTTRNSSAPIATDEQDLRNFLTSERVPRQTAPVIALLLRGV